MLLTNTQREELIAAVEEWYTRTDSCKIYYDYEAGRIFCESTACEHLGDTYAVIWGEDDDADIVRTIYENYDNSVRDIFEDAFGDKAEEKMALVCDEYLTADSNVVTAVNGEGLDVFLIIRENKERRKAFQKAALEYYTDTNEFDELVRYTEYVISDHTK